MALRVLHVHATPGATGGSERTLRLAVEGLTVIGVESHLLYGGPPPQEPADFAGVLHAAEVFGPGQSPARLARSLRLVSAYVRTHRIDLIHVRLWASLPLRRLLLRAAPTVATAHLPICPNGARFQYGNERPCDEAIGRVCLTRGRADYKCGHTAPLDPFGPLGLERGLLRAKAELRLLRAHRLVMAPSEWQRQRLASDGLHAEQIVVVPSPVEVGTTVAPGPAMRGQTPIVFFAARLVRFKGAHHLLEAVARMGGHVQVQIAGEGPAAAELHARAKRLGIADRVAFLGNLGSDEMRRRYAQATVVAVPSLWPETFNRIGPEALAAGTPVVAYASGGVTEWLRPGITGVSVATGDIDAFAEGLRDVLEGPLREVVRVQGPLVAAEFSTRRHAEALVSCYHMALARSGPGAT